LQRYNVNWRGTSLDATAYAVLFRWFGRCIEHDLNTPRHRAQPTGKRICRVWRADSPRWNENLTPEGTEVSMLPAAAEFYKYRGDPRLAQQGR